MRVCAIQRETSVQQQQQQQQHHKQRALFNNRLFSTKQWYVKILYQYNSDVIT